MPMNSAGWWPILVAAVVVAALAAWLASRRFYGRKLAAAAQRLAKSDQGRLAAQRQTAQALQDMQTLRRELDVERQRVKEGEASRPRAQSFESRWPVDEPASGRSLPGVESSHGFADTQILS